LAHDTPSLSLHDALPIYRVGLYIHNLHFALESAGMAGDEKSARDLAGRMQGFLERTAGAEEDFGVPAASIVHSIVRFRTPDEMRSEEHTSELQSLTNLLC